MFHGDPGNGSSWQAGGNHRLLEFDRVIRPPFLLPALLTDYKVVSTTI
jgi:hypothetical protein